jgi:hypothetical protein
MPHLIGGRDRAIAEQIRKHHMARVRPGGARVLVQRRDPHAAHQRGHMLALDDHPCESQQIAQQPTPGKGMLEMEFIA